MNQRPQASPAPAPARAISTPAEARKLAEDLMDVMSGLLGIIERETELVRAGNVREAMRLEDQKGELSRRYMVAVENSEECAKISGAGIAGIADHAAPPSRHFPRDAADQPHRPCDRARGVRRHRARRQRRDPAQEHSEHLYGFGTTRRAGTAQHHPALGQPFAVSDNLVTIFTKFARPRQRGIERIP